MELEMEPCFTAEIHFDDASAHMGSALVHFTILGP